MNIYINDTVIHTSRIRCSEAGERAAFETSYGDSPVLTWFSYGSGEVFDRKMHDFSNGVPQGAGMDPLRVLHPSRVRNERISLYKSARELGPTAVLRERDETAPQTPRRRVAANKLRGLCSAVFDYVEEELGSFEDACEVFYRASNDTINAAHRHGWDSVQDDDEFGIINVFPKL
ncbi:hypothetical protein FOZ60_002607 [Perkinsus olseni]|uniref:Uncharacterized protein n=1 Tax=Perkinsus olseni TaxID=32597 RepID=A0A7J6NYH0_PEROL|nr:hypothetical protein FOZ60_002607 [Perkinsus olseni]